MDAHIARARKMPLAGLPDLRASAAKLGGEALTRRTFMGAAGTAALALGAPRVALAKSAPSVAIVGAGIAGLTCALKLRDRGIAASVYEASGRAGGRMFSNTSYWAQGQVSEWCGELIDTGHETVQALAKRFGLPLDDLHGAEPGGSQDTYKLFGSYYSKSDADSDFLAGVAERVAADAEAADYPTSYDSFTDAGALLDAMSVYDWIESRVPGGHRCELGALLDLAYVTEYGADTRDQSALNLVYLLGYQPDDTGLSVFGESDEAFHIRGGNQRLPNAIAAELGDVSYGYSLRKIAQTAAGRYKLTFDRASGAIESTVDYVVLAIPFAVLRGIDYSRAGFDDLKNEAIQELGRAQNAKTQLQFEKRIWNARGAWPGISNGSSYSDTGYQSSWDVTRAQRGAQGILCFYSGGAVTRAQVSQKAFATAPDAAALADANTALRRGEAVFPGLRAAWTGRATQSIPHKAPEFKASYAYFRVGQYLSFAGYEGVTQGGVLFCGEHTSQDFQGFMEGGASEGVRAARELAQAIRHAG
ncbi:MAG TPA: FAD-dependent oxidoreductase [Polyangiaceae bacterium]|jgi:monoamine oxidase|nr:FAD-dependent oxidoreductase [Polyangiaceae bacterium]